MKIRLQATRYIWVAYAFTMIALFITTVAGRDAISAGHVVIAAAASIMAFLSTGTVWNWGDLKDYGEDEEEIVRKRKNKGKLDAIMARLSEEERDVLRTKLAEYGDEMSYGLSDDGELVQYKR